jgi:carbon monoxide dehydrogenase subunit G
VKLQFFGTPEIAASPERVWQRLLDPRFVARSVPGVESVEVIDARRFQVISGFGVGSLKARLTITGEMFDIVPGTSAKMKMQGKAAGTAVDVLSTIAIQEGEGGRVRLAWSATSELSGPLATMGTGLIEGIARKLTEQFWSDFARRVTEE